MSHDQCPTTVKGEKQRSSKAELAATPRALHRINGQAAWRSMDDMLDTPAFREHLEREFPNGMAELVTRERQDLSADAALLATDPTVATGRKFENRREFLKLMGASMALAGVVATVPGCRRPDHKIYSYGKTVPEEIIPGKPLYYVTAMPRFDGGAEGLLVETHEGRPTKIEGNPLHPINRGKSSMWSLASIMSLYDPDRLKAPIFDNPTRGKLLASWDDFRAWAGEHFGAYSQNGGEGLAFIVEKQSSPTRDAIKASLLKKWPKARWAAIDPSESLAEARGLEMAFGSPMRTRLTMGKDKTRVVVSFDRDFLHMEAEELVHARDFAACRGVVNVTDEPCRLYAFESALTSTGGQADHRLRLAPGRVAVAAVMLARQVLAQLGGADAGGLRAAIDRVAMPGGQDIDALVIEECAKDLVASANRGKSLIVAGPSQPPAIHALVAALNEVLGNVGVSVAYSPLDADAASDSRGTLVELAGAMERGEVKTVVCVGANPVYTAPGSAKFAEAFAKVPARVTLSVGASETAEASTWSLNQASYLESWGDVRAIDGTISAVQPMIKPLYDPAMSEIELLALLAGNDMNAKVDGYDLVRATWRENARALGMPAGGDFESLWRRALHDGLVAATTAKPAAPRVTGDGVAKALADLALTPAPMGQMLEVAFTLGHAGDGRFANVGWLHELPQYGTRVVWDNPVLLSPKTAVELGVAPVGFRMAADEKVAMDKAGKTNPLNAMYTEPTYPTAVIAELTLDGRTVSAPVWICPGVADNIAILTLGYGRRHVGVVGDGVGVDFYPLLGSAGVHRAARGLRLTSTARREMIVSTQNHWTLDGKDSVIRAVDLPAWRKHGGDVQTMVDTFYGTKWDLNFAERLGELSHTPPNISAYTNPYNRSAMDVDKGAVKPGDPAGPKYQQNRAPNFALRPQWGMTIDQTLCTGCGVCTIACQSENNIPVVGKKEVAKGREMSWIRVDRYFTGDDFNNPAAIHHQPVACVHCENAPCEVVCPVNATVHGPEGLNYMTYNRCIGTRYCANNCPYKVRRYNWFDYGVTKFNGGYYFKDQVEAIAPDRGGITGSGEHNKINPNLIPPRLREKLDEISRMAKNPDVTVRSRGVMEKCSYCIQRINAAKIDCKLAGIKDKDGRYVVPDGFFQTACQQACPSNAIIFGDILDVESKVHATRRHARSYGLLNYLNTRPRTSHMLRVMNPNPAILAARDPERFKHMDSPFHGPDGEPIHHHDNVRPADDATGGKAHTFFDKTKRVGDEGYALSLRVLGARMGGVQA